VRSNCLTLDAIGLSHVFFSFVITLLLFLLLAVYPPLEITTLSPILTVALSVQLPPLHLDCSDMDPSFNLPQHKFALVSSILPAPQSILPNLLCNVPTPPSHASSGSPPGTSRAMLFPFNNMLSSSVTFLPCSVNVYSFTSSSTMFT